MHVVAGVTPLILGTLRIFRQVRHSLCVSAAYAVSTREMCLRMARLCGSAVAVVSSMETAPILATQAPTPIVVEMVAELGV